MLCYTNKSPWARLLTLHWPTCNVINLVSRSGEERQLNAVNIFEHDDFGVCIRKVVDSRWNDLCPSYVTVSGGHRD